MLKRISKESKSAFAYLISTVISRGLSVITVPIFTRLMSTDQIGIVNIFNSWYSILSTIASLGLLSGGLTMALQQFKKNKDQYLSSALTLTSLSAVIFGIFYLLFHEQIDKIIDLPSSLIILMIFGFLVAPARDFWLLRQRFEFKYKLSSIITIASSVIATVVSVGVVIYLSKLGMNDKLAEGRLWANYLVVFFIDAIIWIYIFLKGKTFYDHEYWSYSLRLSLPLLIYSLAAQILSVSDRIMIGKMIGNSAAGIYGTLYNVGTLSLMIWTAINGSYSPFLYQNLDSNRAHVKKVTKQILLLFAALSCLVSLLAPEIVRLLATEEYYNAIYILPPIAAGVFLTAASNIFSDILVYVGKTKYIMYGGCISAALNLLLNYFFIKEFGYMAAAFTTMISYIILTLLMAFWANYIFGRSNVNSAIGNKEMFYICLFSLCIMMLGLVLYKLYLVRYAITLIIGFVSWKYYKTFNNRENELL